MEIESGEKVRLAEHVELCVCACVVKHASFADHQGQQAEGQLELGMADQLSLAVLNTLDEESLSERCMIFFANI